MLKIKTLRFIFRETGANRLLYSYLIFVFISALLILIFEPGITTFEDAIWYCYAVVSTAGFGDIVVHTPLAKLISVVVTIYSSIIIAMLTAVVVNYYNEILSIRQQETLLAFFDKLERLPELTPEELKDLSEKVRNYRFK